MKRSIVKHCTPRSKIMWNVILNSSYTSSYIINVDQNKKRKQSPRMRRRDCNLPLNKIAIGGPLLLLLYYSSRHVPRTVFEACIPRTRADAHGYNLRNPNLLTLPPCRTEKLRRSFIPSTIKLFNNKSK